MIGWNRALWVVVVLLFGALIGISIAQQPDKKDYALAALEAQRNEAWNREARCQSEAQFMIDDLKKQIADLKKQLEEKQ
jgi:uncharacterized membrane protein YukC